MHFIDMNKIQRYSSVVFTLLLIAGPWLSVQEIRTDTEKIVCNCCQGPCQGCCCSAPDNKESKSDTDQNNKCKCELSDFPAIPEQPVALPDHKQDNQKNKYLIAILSSIDRLQFQSRDISRVSGTSPPDFTPFPLYILNASFLI